MRTTLRAAVLAILLWVATQAIAHRLDELLQATTISLAKNHVTAQLRLTPGVDVFPIVFADIDTNGDGLISDAEQRAYAERIRRDVVMTIDGNRVDLRLVSLTFPRIDEMKEGLGDILLTFDTIVAAGGRERKLIFENHYQRGISLYLVNCLFPSDPGIQITAQNRNEEQSSYRVDYTQAGTQMVR